MCEINPWEDGQPGLRGYFPSGNSFLASQVGVRENADDPYFGGRILSVYEDHPHSWTRALLVVGLDD